MSLPFETRPDFLQPRAHDSGPMIATICGSCFGASVWVLQSFISPRLALLDSARLKFFILLILAALSGTAAIVLTRKLSSPFSFPPSRRGRLGVTAGVFCAVVGGGTFTLIAVLNAMAAQTAAQDLSLRGQSWLVLAFCAAAFLPSVLCGFVGGLIGSSLASTNAMRKLPSPPLQPAPWLKAAQFGLMIVGFMGLASPIGLLAKARVVDPPPPPPKIPELPPPPPPPPAFNYQPPEGIISAGVGEIEPDFIKRIANVQHGSPAAMSPDGRLMAFCSSEGTGSTVTVYDLHKFIPIASIGVPVTPEGNLAWASDQRSISCTLGQGAERRIWVLGIDAGTAIELPRPPGRDVPGGALHWWQEHELAFFPDDESPLVFDLEKLLFAPFADSPHYAKLDETQKERWKNGPRTEWPNQAGWKLGLKTVVTSATPPPRRNPESPWDLQGVTYCAYEHPQLPLSSRIEPLTVNANDRIFCSPDGTKIARQRDDEIQVVYMKKATRPDIVVEVEMPKSPEQLQSDGWKSRVDSKELCLFICDPLINPLNHEIVGADYKQVHAIARLHEWIGNKATFVVFTIEGKMKTNGVAVTLHTWNEGKMSEWKAPGTQNWWAPIRIVPSAAPEKMSAIQSPQLLHFAHESAGLLVTNTPQQRLTETAPKTTSAPTPLPQLISEGDVKLFLTEHHAKASRGDVSGMVADYDTVVDFLDKGLIPSTAIDSEERAQRQRWPKGNEQIVNGIQVTEDGAIWNAAYTMTFSNENASGEWHKGRADLKLTLRAEGTKLFITSQKARIYDVTDNKPSIPKPEPPSTPAKQVSKNVPATVPKPCFLMVWRSKEMPQVEITDYISFEGRIAWHRTYREMSPDGKVLRSCRAMYSGSGGLSQDRSTARIYVEMQEWDRDLGGGTFTGVCQRNARASVGKAFQFHFINGGMVESQLGMVFQRLD